MIKGNRIFIAIAEINVNQTVFLSILNFTISIASDNYIRHHNYVQLNFRIVFRKDAQ